MRNLTEGSPQLNIVRAMKVFLTTLLALPSGSQDGCSPFKHQALPTPRKVRRKGHCSSNPSLLLPDKNIFSPVNFHLCLRTGHILLSFLLLCNQLS